jgi:hypothetical protein
MLFVECNYRYLTMTKHCLNTLQCSIFFSKEKPQTWKYLRKCTLFYNVNYRTWLFYIKNHFKSCFATHYANTNSLTQNIYTSVRMFTVVEITGNILTFKFKPLKRCFTSVICGFNYHSKRTVIYFKNRFSED